MNNAKLPAATKPANMPREGKKAPKRVEGALRERFSDTYLTAQESDRAELPFTHMDDAGLDSGSFSHHAYFLFT